ncbi:hypothetical protein [Trebonia kvetii]|uniref:hypothetical protein n=1 Tax=Trebonia kvetii TaxID=2480626 RepID=UPI0016521134|nr:hypothetical protein [Trebonia kvetii]
MPSGYLAKDANLSDPVVGGATGRTYRQQAVIDYVVNNLKTGGVLSDVGKLGALLSSAKKYVQIPRNWDLIQFGGEISGLTPVEHQARHAAHDRGGDRPQRRRSSVHGRHPQHPADCAAGILGPARGRHHQAGQFRQGP